MAAGPSDFTSPSATRSFGATTDPAVVIPVLGPQWASVLADVSGTFVGTALWEYSNDGGNNWLTAPYGKRIDATSANPTFAATTTAVSKYVIPVPSDCTHYKVRCSAYTSGTINVVLSGFLPYVPGVTVSAVLYDVTEGSIGAGLSAGVFDFSGWSSVLAFLASPTTQSWTLRTVDDTGAAISGSSFVGTAAGTSTINLTRQGATASAPTIGLNAFTAAGGLSRRMSANLPAGGTVSTGRLRIEVSR